MTILETIQRLQYSDLEAAQTLLLDFIRDVFALDVSEVALRPLAVSLNSFNGFVTLSDGARLFFKSHVEPGGVIAEYYNSDLLEQAGYPVIRPVRASTTPGQQMLLYEVVTDRSLFDAAWALERERPDDAAALESLTRVQHTADDDLRKCYLNSLAWQDAEAHAAAPVHQLFHHRLTRGRLDTFYGPGSVMTLPGRETVPTADVRRVHWTINGIRYRDTLNDVIARAVDVLNPAVAGPAIVGHGDAHNGNVFLRIGDDAGQRLVYFDPAFAGRHDPLLDLVKPLYHNAFAMWMYFPDILESERGATLTVTDGGYQVTYPLDLHPVREMFFMSKTARVLVAVLRALDERRWLRPDWRSYLRAALACCPLLTMNLADAGRFPPAIALLGLAHVVEMGAVSENGGGYIEQWLDAVESGL